MTRVVGLPAGTSTVEWVVSMPAVTAVIVSVAISRISAALLGKYR
jgi:hypothetical protein